MKEIRNYRRKSVEKEEINKALKKNDRRGVKTTNERKKQTNKQTMNCKKEKKKEEKFTGMKIRKRK